MAKCIKCGMKISLKYVDNKDYPVCGFCDGSVANAILNTKITNPKVN